MGLQESLRLLAGVFVLAGLVLGFFVHAGWYLLVAFVALNLIQSAFTRWCPAIWILRKAGVRERCSHV